MNPNTGPGVFTYTTLGTNTPTQVTDNPITIFNLSIEQNGGSAGFLHLYNNGTTQVEGPAGTYIGTPNLAFAVPSGTSGAGTPAIRDLTFPNGLGLGSGLTILWAAGPTGTVAHGVNATINIVRSNLT